MMAEHFLQLTHVNIEKEVFMKEVIARLKEHQSATPSKWRERAEWRMQNKSWLRHSQRIAVKMLEKMDELSMTQKQLAAETGIKPSVLSETINGKRSVSLSVAVALEKALGISADIWMNMQTQYDLDTANITERDNQRQTVSITIPMRDRNLLQELVRKFGWACVF